MRFGAYRKTNKLYLSDCVTPCSDGVQITAPTDAQQCDPSLVRCVEELHIVSWAIWAPRVRSILCTRHVFPRLRFMYIIVA